MHALALVAHLIPAGIAGLLQRLAEIIRHDPSVIVRDNAVKAVGSYASTGDEAALAAYPLLVEALSTWDGKQAALALEGLANVGSAATGLCDELWSIGIRYHDDRRARVRKAAKALTKVKRSG